MVNECNWSADCCSAAWRGSCKLARNKQYDVTFRGASVTSTVIRLKPVIGKAHLVASVLGINDPLVVQVKQVGVAVPVICLSTPVCLPVVDQLPCVLSHKLIPLDVLLPQHNIQISMTNLGFQSLSLSSPSAL